jgi:hypothetical protein
MPADPARVQLFDTLARIVSEEMRIAVSAVSSGTRVSENVRSKFSKMIGRDVRGDCVGALLDEVVTT